MPAPRKGRGAALAAGTGARTATGGRGLGGAGTAVPAAGSVAEAACFGLAVSVFAAILSSVVLGRIPHIQDAVAQLFQARIFASGHLWVPSPPLREFFDYAHMINDGRWYSQYPPGHPLLLVPFVLAGAPWLANPFYAGLGTIAMVLLAGDLFGRWTARLAGALAIGSPFLVLMAAGFMSHPTGFFALCFFLLFYFRAMGWGPKQRWTATMAGLFLLIAVLIRPYTALAFALPLVLVSGVQLLRSGAVGRVRAVPVVVSCVLGGLGGLVLYGLYNRATTGDPMVPGYLHLYGPSHGIGFGKAGWGPPHTLATGIRHAARDLAGLNRWLYLWPVTSLWPLVTALLPGRVGGLGLSRTDPRETDRARGTRGGVKDGGEGGESGAATGIGFGPRLRWLLLMPTLAVLAAYLLYWFHDAFWPRYLYDALAPLLILSAVGVHRAGSIAVSLASDRSRTRARHSVPTPRAAGVALVLWVILSGAAAIGRWPELFRPPPEARHAPPATPVRIASYFQAVTPDFWAVSPALGRLVASRNLTNALVFTRFHEPRISNIQMRYVWFGSAFAHQSPDLNSAPVVYAHDRGAANAHLAALFPDRTVYLYEGSIEGGVLTQLTPPEVPR